MVQPKTNEGLFPMNSLPKPGECFCIRLNLAIQGVDPVLSVDAYDVEVIAYDKGKSAMWIRLASDADYEFPWPADDRIINVGDGHGHELYVNETTLGKSSLKPQDEFKVIDEVAVDNFAKLMKQKLACAREKGRGGWHDPRLTTAKDLAEMLVEHLDKCNDGNYLDISNFCMMLHIRGESEHYLEAALQKKCNELAKSSIKHSENEIIDALTQKCEEQRALIEHIASITGDEEDPMACWNTVNMLQYGLEQAQLTLHELTACVEQLSGEYGKGFYDGLEYQYAHTLLNQSEEERTQIARNRARERSQQLPKVELITADALPLALAGLRKTYPGNEPKSDYSMCMTNAGVQCWDSGVWLRPCIESEWDNDDHGKVQWFIELDQFRTSQEITRESGR